MAQISRLHNVNISAGKRAFSEYVNNEFDQLVDAHNDVDTRVNSNAAAVAANQSEINRLQDEKLDKTEVVAQAEANKVLRLDSGSKLPASVTGDADATVTKLNTHKTSSDHDGRYYTKSEVYSKEELVPYLEGGNTTRQVEAFTIINSDNGDGTFTYKDDNDVQHIGELDGNGYQIFTLQKGFYITGENLVEAIINDTLRRDAVSGGLEEVDQTHVKLTDPQGNGAEITVIYFERIGIAGEHRVYYTGDTTPPPETSSATIWFKVVG